MPSVLRLQQRQRQRTTHELRAISLDDNWEEVANRIARSASTKSLEEWSTIVQKTVQKLNWNPPFSKEWFAALQTAAADVLALYRALPWYTELAVVLVPISALLLSALYRISRPVPGYRSGMEPYARGNYDPVAAQAYYSRHRFLVAQRALELLRLSNRFLFNVAVDKYVLRREEANRARRAQELLALITDLGALSVRDKIGSSVCVCVCVISCV